jgi:ABC-type sugar transport system permease subunit
MLDNTDFKKTGLTVKSRSFFTAIKDGISYVIALIGKFITFIFYSISRGLNWFFNLKFIKPVVNVVAYPFRKLIEKTTYRQRKALWGVVFIIPLVIGFIFFFVLPFFTTIFYSFSWIGQLGVNDYTKDSVGYTTSFVGFDNYRYLWSGYSTSLGTFPSILSSTAWSIILNIPLVMIFSLIIAVVLNTKFFGRAFIRAVFFMPVIFNSQAVDQAMTQALTLSGAIEGAGETAFTNIFNFSNFLLNVNLPGNIVTFLTTTSDQIYNVLTYSGVQILIFLAAIQSVPKHLYEAAKIEGATQYEIFWKITFPMVSPMMMPVCIFTVIDSLMRSALLTNLKAFELPGIRITMYSPLGELSTLGIHAAMSLLFCLITIVIILLAIGLISLMVFYYDE